MVPLARAASSRVIPPNQARISAQKLPVSCCFLTEGPLTAAAQQSRRNHRGLSPAAAALLPPALEGARQRARCPASHPAQLPHHTAAHASSSGLLDIILWLRNREKPTPKKTAPELAPSTAGSLCSQDTTAHVCRKQPASPGLEGLPLQHHNTKLQRGEECNSSGKKSASGLGGGTGELQEHSWQVSVF